MRACVIFNPTARGEKARRFREFLLRVGPEADLRPTTGPGAARTLARQAAEDGHLLVVAAGGDGTVHEVLNGLADVPSALDRVVLGVLPLGTANVLAHELGLPQVPARAWEALATAEVRSMDLGIAEYHDAAGGIVRAHFAIVAGAGLDARAVQGVHWELKRRTGKLAYLEAAWRALLHHDDRVRCLINGQPFEGRAVLAGNGRLYAGDIDLFGDGSLGSGRLHVRGVKRVTPGLLLASAQAYLTGRWPRAAALPGAAVEELRLEAEGPVPLQLDGEFVGWLPATLRILPGALQILAPRPAGSTAVPVSGSAPATPSRPPSSAA